ncbi:MAG: hypothetical protein WCA15_19820 [Candidatus Acidiferrales bacterium]
MLVHGSKPASFFRRLRRWVSNHAIQDVPGDIALCEFDCRKQQCTSKEWATCERRISGASGVLKPPKVAGRDDLDVILLAIADFHSDG